MLTGNIDPEVIAFLQEWYNEKEEVIGHTSGSTGKPKEIRLLKKDMIASASLTNEYFHIGPQSRLLLCLSPTYIAGKMMIVRTILSGADLITIKPTSSPLQNIENDIDFAAMVPMQVETTLTNPETRSRFARIKQVIIGGAAVSPTLEQGLQELPTRCYGTYGMTETGFAYCPAGNQWRKKISRLFCLGKSVLLHGRKRMPGHQHPASPTTEIHHERYCPAC